MKLIFVHRIIFSIQDILWIQVIRTARSNLYGLRSPASTNDVRHAVMLIALIIMDVSRDDYDLCPAISLAVLKQFAQRYLLCSGHMDVVSEGSVRWPMEGNKDVIDLRRY